MKLKVKHIFFLILFAIPFALSLIYIIVTQNGDGIASNFVVGYLIMFLMFSVYALGRILIETIKLLIVIWNYEI